MFAVTSVSCRDCSDLNNMLEASSMYPYGFDPILQNTAVDWKKGRAKFKNRSECPNIKYFFIDFGLSTHFTNDNMERLVTGTMCQANVPELSDWVPYDPFAVDIYLLGDVYQRAFIKVRFSRSFPLCRLISTPRNTRMSSS